jgi:hypothetical protein
MRHIIDSLSYVKRKDSLFKTKGRGIISNARKTFFADMHFAKKQ